VNLMVAKSYDSARRDARSGLSPDFLFTSDRAPTSVDEAFENANFMMVRGPNDFSIPTNYICDFSIPSTPRIAASTTTAPTRRAAPTTNSDAYLFS
jgi:hypothetical protein